MNAEIRNCHLVWLNIIMNTKSTEASVRRLQSYILNISFIFYQKYILNDPKPLLTQS